LSNALDDFDEQIRRNGEKGKENGGVWTVLGDENQARRTWSVLSASQLVLDTLGTVRERSCPSRLLFVLSSFSPFLSPAPYSRPSSSPSLRPAQQSMPGSGITLTGKLGEVIKESATIALAFLRSHAFELGLTDDVDKDLLEKRAIHLHMPEGSIGKEGPSAGIAILTAFVSLFSKKGISSELGGFTFPLCFFSLSLN
jgi:hypothetical protein